MAAMAPHVPLGLRPARATPRPGQRLAEARLEHAGSFFGCGVGMFPTEIVLDVAIRVPNWRKRPLVPPLFQASA